MMVEMLSGPSAFEFLAFFIALMVSARFIWISASVGLFFSFLSVGRKSFVGLHIGSGVYCLLNWLASFLGLCTGASLKKIAWFTG